MTAVHTATRSLEERERTGPAHVQAEHLRDQIFAACGYALAVAATAVGLLTPHLGRLGLVAGIVLAVLLVPVNVAGIRRFARLRRSLTTQRAAAPAEAREKAETQRRASQR